MLGIGKMGFEERDIPEVKDDEVLVKLEYVGICGSDLHYYESGAIGDYVVEPPFVLGHEPGGTVVEVGRNVKHLKVGDRVALEPGKTCEHCEFCKTGRYNLCPDVVFFATPPVDGVSQEYVAHEADLCFKLPDNVSTLEGALIDKTHTRWGRYRPWLLIAVIYGGIFAACHIFCFSKTKEVVDIPKKQKLSLKTQLRAALKNKPYMIAVAGQLLFGLTLYGRNADALYYFTYVEGDAALSQFFFSGFNTAIYAVIPDCVEYVEWKTGLRNDGFQYAFISLGKKVGMAIGTSLLAAILELCGYVANQQQNSAVLSVIRHFFTTVPGILWIVTAGVLLFYRLNKKTYQKIVTEIQERKSAGESGV